MGKQDPKALLAAYGYDRLWVRGGLTMYLTEQRPEVGGTGWGRELVAWGTEGGHWDLILSSGENVGSGKGVRQLKAFLAQRFGARS